MDQLLQFARGPLFIMTFLFMILSLARLFALHAIHIYNVMTNTNDTSVNPPELARCLRGFRHQALHAERLTLRHPLTGQELGWEAPPPPDMHELINVLREETK